MPFALRFAPLLLAGGLLIACGGGGDAPAPTGTPAATEPPAGTQAPVPTSQPAFERFRYSVRLDLTLDAPSTPLAITRVVEGFFAAPDSHAFHGFLGTEGITPDHEVVVIGNDAWLREASGPWTARERAAIASSTSASLTTLVPGFLNDAGFGARLAALPGAPEEDAGRSLLRYTLTIDDIDAIVPLLANALLSDPTGVEELDASLWVDEATGALVRVELTGKATPAAVLGASVPAEVPADSRFVLALSVDVTRIDDPGIAISTPI